MKPDRTSMMIAPAGQPFPVFGAMHPLQLNYCRFLVKGAAVAASLHLAAFAGWLVARSLEDVAPPEKVIRRVIDPINFGSPPSITKPQAEQVPVALAPQAQPEFGIPEPVEDWRADASLFGTVEQLAQSFEPVSTDLLGSGEGDLVIQVPDARPEDVAEPDDWVAVEEMPQLIHMPSPIYPDMARQAEVEGTVVILVLVGKDGKVIEARVDRGIPMLDAAALAAARGAVFRPALQQHRPVKVWVRIPMTFRLDG